MYEVLALAAKDLRLLVRDKAGFVFTIVWPFVVAIIFGTMFGGGGGDSGPRAVPLVVVDEDGTQGSREFVAKMEEAPELAVTLADREEAEDLVRRGKSVAYVILRPGFGEARGSMFWGPPPEVELGTDPSRRSDAAMIEGILMKYASERIQEFFSDRQAQEENLARARRMLSQSPDMAPEVRSNLDRFFSDLDRFLGDEAMSSEADTTGGFGGFTPLKVDRAVIARRRSGPRSGYAISFPQGVIWGIIGATAAFGISLVVERTHGTLHRLQIAPISRTQVLAGKGLACFVATTIIATALFVLARFAFDLKPDSVPLLILAVVSSSVAFVGVMMLLSVLGKTEQSAGGIGWAVLLVMAMLGGGMIPLLAMPGWMRAAGNVSPVKWSILAMEGAIWRHFSLVEMMLPCGILIGVGVICFAIGVRAFSWATRS
jgi:ABC-2 type transport system permease protein